MTGRIARDRKLGCLFGLAYGDALGRPTEFMTYRMIVRMYGRKGPNGITPDRWQVTDDTMMTIAVADALTRAQPVPDALVMGPRFAEAFANWSRLPQEGRAPGGTCMTACRQLIGHPFLWRSSGELELGKGCGANMRVAPVGLSRHLTINDMAILAQAQSLVTHAHPTALAASELTAVAVRLLALGLAPAALPVALVAHCARRMDEPAFWFVRKGIPMATGWRECRNILRRVVCLTQEGSIPGDPSALIGAGWVAEEALATAVYCAWRFHRQPVRAIRYAAATGGDSDSIASITGALLGAAYGMKAWPRKWRSMIEFGEVLDQAARAL